MRNGSEGERESINIKKQRNKNETWSGNKEQKIAAADATKK